MSLPLASTTSLSLARCKTAHIYRDLNAHIPFCVIFAQCFYPTGQQAVHLAAQGQGYQAVHRRGEGQEARRQGLDSPCAPVFHAPINCMLKIKT